MQICPSEEHFKIGTYWVYYNLHPAKASSAEVVLEAGVFPVVYEEIERCEGACLSPGGSSLGIPLAEIF